MNVAVILPAAGLGTRMARSSAERAGVSRKQFMLLEGLPILVHSFRRFLSSPRVREIIVAVRSEEIGWVEELLATHASGKPFRVVKGGDSRQESVENALAAIAPDIDFVAVHDAVRPFVDAETIEKVFDAAESTGAAIVGIVPVDTVKQVTKGQLSQTRIRATIPRDGLILAQTPQVFRVELLRQAYAAAAADSFHGTDESSLVERLEQVQVAVVLGSDRNIKITRPGDMDLARLLFAQDPAPRGAA